MSDLKARPDAVYTRRSLDECCACARLSMTPNPTQRPPNSNSNVLRVGCGILGIGLVLFGLFVAGAAIADLVINRNPKEAPALVGMTVFFGGLAVVGVIAAWKFLRSAPAPPDIDLENRVLQLAEAKGCRLTVGMVALHCRLSLEESRAALERMVMQGAATPEVEDDGGIVYDFSDLLPSGKSKPAAAERPISLP